MTDESSLIRLKEHFLAQQKLPPSYWSIAQKWFIPMFEQLASHQIDTNAPILIGVNGAQGSGKSTVTELMVAFFNDVAGIPTIGFSIDDFYLSKSKREALATSVNPLLATRGVPGTHDTDLLDKVLEDLKAGKDCTIPRFDKSIDDLFPTANWIKVVDKEYKIIILEGWCVGSRAVDDKTLNDNPNNLEQTKDTDLSWRKYVNAQLSQHYAPIFARLDKLIMLKAPSFSCVYKWRLEQEHKMRSSIISAVSSSSEQQVPQTKIGMSDEEIHNFIQYYQRITEENLRQLPSACDYVFELDEQRNIFNCDTL
ncbi:kinase [Agaribacter flavus]|uniref:Kinase n=1 Tax=Agaribacter flavus TaxID=1902781 RepID=A0ABV7FTL2_9ALTE